MDIAQLLATLAQTLGLPEGSTAEQIMAEIQKLQEAAVTATDDAEAQVTAAKDEVDAANAATEEQKALTQEAEQRFANEREARINLMLDNAIASGNITPAGRSAWFDRLAKDIESGSIALANERAMKVAPVVTTSVAAAASRQTRRNSQLLDLANELVRERKGEIDFHTAFLRVKAEHPELVK